MLEITHKHRTHKNYSLKCYINCHRTRHNKRQIEHMRCFFCLLPICFNSWENRMQCWYGRLFFTINCISLSMNSFISSVQLQILYIFIYVQWTNKLTHRLRCLSTWRWSTKGRYEDRAVISSNITPSSPFKSVKKTMFQSSPCFHCHMSWLYNLILTQLEEIWKTTSIVLKMEDNLKFLKMEDALNVLVNGRWP